MKDLNLTLGAGAAALAFGLPADAAGPYVVDDADITPTGRCQIETWLTAGGGGTVVAAPACTPAFAPRTEITLSGRRAGDETAMGLGGKWNLRPFGASRIGASVSAQLDWDVDHGDAALLALNAPVTFRLREGIQAHLNAGWAYDPRTEIGAATWGVAYEARANPRLTLAAEVFGDSRGSVGWQAGLRPHIVADKIDLDLTIGQPDTASGDVRTTVGLSAAF